MLPLPNNGVVMIASGVVYIATNKQDGRKYVGQTIKGLRERLRIHFKERPGIPFSEDLKKHGTDGFVFEQIMYSADALDEWEKYFIGKFNTVYPGGYNLTEGGKRAYRCSGESKRRNANGHVGKKLSEEHKEKLRKYSGVNHPCYGKTLSEETKRKISLAHEGMKKPISKETIEKIREAKLRYWANRRSATNESGAN